MRFTSSFYFKIMDAKTYIKHASKRINTEEKRWIDVFLSFLKNKSLIFEVGSGTGRFSNYIEKRGYFLIRSDVDKAFIKYQSRKFNKMVYLFDIIVGHLPKKIPKEIDGLFIGCVFNFLSPYGVNSALTNSKKILRSKGYLAFNVSMEWGENDVKKLLKKHSLKLERLFQDKWWYYIICKRK